MGRRGEGLTCREGSKLPDCFGSLVFCSFCLLCAAPAPTPPHPPIPTSDGARQAGRGREGRAAAAHCDWLGDTFGLHWQDSTARATAAAPLFFFFIIIPISSSERRRRRSRSGGRTLHQHLPLSIFLSALHSISLSSISFLNLHISLLQISSLLLLIPPLSPKSSSRSLSPSLSLSSSLPLSLPLANLHISIFRSFPLLRLLLPFPLFHP